MTNETKFPTTKAALLARIEGERDALNATLARFSEADLAAPVSPDSWSVKDHLIHLAAWSDGITALLNHQSRWGVMGITTALGHSGDFDAINAAIQMLHHDRPLEEVRDAFDQAHRDLVATISGLEDEHLLQPYSFFDPDDPRPDREEPVVGWIAGNSYEHDAEHREIIMALLSTHGS